MKYRRFGTLEWDVSMLGLGVRGLPDPADSPSGGAEAAAADWVRVARHAIDQGVNYLDLDFSHDAARRQWVAGMVGRALGSGYRDKLKIAVTVPVVLGQAGGFRRLLEEQLEWLGIDHADFCVIGPLDRQNWPRLRDGRLLEDADRTVAEGRTRHLGFAFRDQLFVLKQIVDEYRGWSLARFEFNYLHHYDPGIAGLDFAAERGLAVVVTQPTKGGRLVAALPIEDVDRVWAGSHRAWSPAEWALRYVWDHPAVSTAVCDVVGANAIRECLAVSSDAGVGGLTVRDRLAINRARDALGRLRSIDCASCRPCMPCSQGIDIPRIFEIYNDAVTFGDTQAAARAYRDEGHRADRCNGCGQCESRCCQSPPLPISRWLSTAHDLLG